MPIKVTFIGAGSVGFTRELTRDILTVPELRDTHFAFHDINAHNLDMLVQLCEKDIRENRLPARITPSLDRRRALADADYVINCARIGGLEAFQTDIEIPLKYGIDQCVGDTLCAGGIMYGQRNIPQILAFCKDMKEVSKSDVLFLNYANPMAMNCWAALDYTGIRTLGLCHGVEDGHLQIARALGAKDMSEVEIICAGINHQTWYIKILYQGREIGSAELLAAYERHPGLRNAEKVRIDVLRRFGYYSTETNGHLSEYLPWYRKRKDDILKWIDLSFWAYGETAGYLRDCIEGRNWFEHDFPAWLKEKKPPIAPEHRGQERGSYIIEALETGRIWRGHLNVRNQGAITNLPDDCVVEVPGYIDRTGIHIPRVGDLPLACAATCNVSIGVQRMAKEAAVHGDVTLLKQAMLHDPLTGAVCDPDEIWQMTDEMLVAQAAWLPQYKHAIADAKHRLAKARPLGTNQWKGAARLRPKSVQEMQAKAEEHRAHASASNRAAAPLVDDAAAVIRNKAGGSALEKVSGNGRKPVLSKVEHTPSERQ